MFLTNINSLKGKSHKSDLVILILGIFSLFAKYYSATKLHLKYFTYTNVFVLTYIHQLHLPLRICVFNKRRLIFPVIVYGITCFATIRTPARIW